MVRSLLAMMTAAWSVAAHAGPPSPDSALPLDEVHKHPKPRRPAGAPSDAWIAHALEPETSADSYCQRNVAAARKRDASAKDACGPVPGQPKPKLGGPWTDARLVQLDSPETGYVTLSQYIELVVQLDGRWFSHRIGHISHPSTNDAKHTWTVRRIYVKDVIPGGHPELLVELAEHDQSGIGGSVESTAKREHLDVCGVGASGAPSCTRFTVAEDEVNSVFKRRYRLAWSFDKQGRLVLRAKAPWPKGLAKRDHESTRPIFFR
jgi:hypothetical protein